MWIFLHKQTEHDCTLRPKNHDQEDSQVDASQRKFVKPGFAHMKVMKVMQASAILPVQISDV